MIESETNNTQHCGKQEETDEDNHEASD